MRKNLLIIGLVLLVVGVAVAGTSAFEITGGTIHSLQGASNVVNLGPNGDYYSNTITVSPGYEIVVVSTDKVYLIPSQDLSSVNSSNIVDYSISPDKAISGSSSNVLIFNGLNGSYVVVVFGVSAPSTMDYAVIKGNGLGSIVIFGVLVILGIVLAIIGIIIAVIGLILRPKNMTNKPY